MSDSEDDFMSDKFLVDAPPSGPSTYTSKRSAQQLKSMRKGQANNQISAKKLEEQRRREGLNTSLFDSLAQDEKNDDESTSAKKAGGGGGGGKAMELMMKMGWKVGEGLGKKRSPSPPAASSSYAFKRSRLDDGDNEEEKGEDENGGTARGGIGSASRSHPQPTARTEPIRVSLWQGRKGLSARVPSPPPLPNPSNRNPDALDPKKLERLGKETEDFRLRQRREFEEKERERKEWKARDLLVTFDQGRGVKFHPLHVMPSDPLGTLPRPLLKLIYPAQALSPSPTGSPEPLSGRKVEAQGLEDNLSAAERLREQMRRDLLTELKSGEDDDIHGEDMRFGIPIADDVKPSSRAGPGKNKDEVIEASEEGVDWESMVSGTKRVLSTTNAEHLNFLVSQLRHDYHYCFWCSYKYTSYEEMEGSGGCPGEDEDDH